MGHSSKKKKRGGGGRKRAPSKDNSSLAGDDRDLLSDEITALAAIFQEDFKIVSESPPTQFFVNLRPHSNEMGIEDPNVSARLLVRCLPGYPFKCPKLNVIPEKGLTEKDADQLLALLLDQAKINTREGRVMIFNLVEVAHEFLSEIVQVSQSLESVHCLVSNRKDHPLHDETTVTFDLGSYSEGPPVYGSIDLYGDLCGDESSWGDCGTKVVDGNCTEISRKQANNIEMSRRKSNIDNLGPVDNFFPDAVAGESHATNSGVAPHTTPKSIILEGAENSNKSSSSTPSVESVPDTSEGTDSELQEDILGEKRTDSCDSYSDDDSLTSFLSATRDDESQSKKKDLLMVHLLRLACSSRGSLSHALPEISLELYNLGVISEGPKIWLSSHHLSLGKPLIMHLGIK